MNKTEAIRAIIEATTAEPIVFTTGYACRIAAGIADRPNHFYMTGSMGLAASIGVGIAQQTRQPTIVVDGDGALLMNPVGLLIAGAQSTLPFIHLVLDDGSYASTGGQGVPSETVDVTELARACGYRRVLEIDDTASITSLLGDELEVCPSPIFVRCVLRGPDQPITARIGGDLSDHAARFAESIRMMMKP